MKYKVIFVYDTNEVPLETNNKQEAINKLKELELREYQEYLDYHQSCAENYEASADFYPSYYIQVDGDEMFDITDYMVLERRED